MSKLEDNSYLLCQIWAFGFKTNHDPIQVIRKDNDNESKTALGNIVNGLFKYFFWKTNDNFWIRKKKKVISAVICKIYASVWNSDPPNTICMQWYFKSLLAAEAQVPCHS